MNFADRLLKAIDDKENNPSIIGLDSDFTKLPNCIKEKYEKKYGKTFEAVAMTIIDFNKQIIGAIKDIIPAVKIQMAFYEQYGQWGVWAFEETVKMAREANLVIVEDAKRNDIGNTSMAYANGHLGKVDVFGEKKQVNDIDCITVNAYLGTDAIQPFIDVCKENNKGIFVLVKTSNPSSSELQNLETDNGKKIYEVMAEQVNIWGETLVGESGYSSVGAVVGATHPEEAELLRKKMPKAIFLVPGYGAQGGGVDGAMKCFNSDGKGAVIHSARGVIFAYQKVDGADEKDFAKYARESAIKMKEEITSALKNR